MDPLSWITFINCSGRSHFDIFQRFSTSFCFEFSGSLLSFQTKSCFLAIKIALKDSNGTILIRGSDIRAMG